MDNPIPEELKSDHLFLLIGTNPLPNYVVAKLLLRKGGQLYLVHSKGEHGTGEIALRLEVLLKENDLITYAIPIEVNESDAVDIYNQIRSKATSIDEGSIGLNYTGGTKVMAVQAYKAIADSVSDRAVFSYLDARSYQMRFEQSSAGKNVLLAVSLELKDLLKLHNIKLHENLPKRITTLINSAKVLAELHANIELIKDWRYWCETALKPKVKKCKDKRFNDYGNHQSESVLKTLSLVWPTQPEFQEIINSICSELNLPVSDALELSMVKQSGQFKKIKHFCEWLDGKWLEHFVLDQIQQVVDDCDLADYGMDLNTEKNSKGVNFEFDIGAMRGYQLFGFSCSTDPSLAKSKLFEANIRVQQLGGDEARTGLICPVDEATKSKLQKQVEQDAPGKVRVFGASDLINLKDELAQWFIQADHQR